MKRSKDVQGMTTFESNYCEAIKGIELETIKCEEWSLEANTFKVTNYIGRQCVQP